MDTLKSFRPSICIYWMIRSFFYLPFVRRIRTWWIMRHLSLFIHSNERGTDDADIYLFRASDLIGVVHIIIGACEHHKIDWSKNIEAQTNDMIEKLGGIIASHGTCRIIRTSYILASSFGLALALNSTIIQFRKIADPMHKITPVTIILYVIIFFLLSLEAMNMVELFRKGMKVETLLPSGQMRFKVNAKRASEEVDYNIVLSDDVTLHIEIAVLPFNIKQSKRILDKLVK